MTLQPKRLYGQRPQWRWRRSTFFSGKFVRALQSSRGGLILKRCATVLMYCELRRRAMISLVGYLDATRGPSLVAGCEKVRRAVICVSAKM